LTQFACGFCRNPAEAEDAVQITCERALMRWYQWTGAGSLQHWLMKILINVYRDELRSQRAQLDIDIDLLPEPIACQTESIDEVFLQEIYERVQCLPESQRQVLSLFAEGVPYRDISRLLAVPIGTVMSRLSRARASLLADLGQI
jgi:RNA polymerase sigma-70 factor (ECF subfamily)